MAGRGIHDDYPREVSVEILLALICPWTVFLVPYVADRIQDWHGRRTFPWWRYRIYWESWLDTSDRPIEVSSDWALERIRLANRRPGIELRMAVRCRVGSEGDISVRAGGKVIRFRERAIPGDDEFS